MIEDREALEALRIGAGSTIRCNLRVGASPRGGGPAAREERVRYDPTVKPLLWAYLSSLRDKRRFVFIAARRPEVPSG
jgi:hypothetical protein